MRAVPGMNATHRPEYDSFRRSSDEGPETTYGLGWFGLKVTPSEAAQRVGKSWELRSDLRQAGSSQLSQRKLTDKPELGR
jgi:hypothetical protein